MILFSSCLDSDSLILVLFWTRTLRFSTGNSLATKLSTRAQPISRTVIECLDHGNNFVCYEPSAVNSSVGGSKLHSSSCCTFLKVFRIFPNRVNTSRIRAKIDTVGGLCTCVHSFQLQRQSFDWEPSPCMRHLPKG